MSSSNPPLQRRRPKKYSLREEATLQKRQYNWERNARLRAEKYETYFTTSQFLKPLPEQLLAPNLNPSPPPQQLSVCQSPRLQLPDQQLLDEQAESLRSNSPKSITFQPFSESLEISDNIEASKKSTRLQVITFYIHYFIF